jgi:hypothetical protein
MMRSAWPEPVSVTGTAAAPAKPSNRVVWVWQSPRSGPETSDRSALVACRRPHERQLLRILVRQGPKQNGVGDAEDRHVAADAERQGHDDHRREQRVVERRSEWRT